MSLAALANPLQGTDSSFDFSRGNTYPAVATPFGMTAWSPQTNETSFFYRHRDVKLQGVRATHQASPWMGDYGHLTLMPVVGPLSMSASARASGFRHDEEEAKPYRYAVRLRRFDTLLEVAPTTRCGVLKITYPAAADKHLVLEPGPGFSSVEIDPERGCIQGFTRAVQDPGSVPEGFACYFVLEVSAPFARSGTFQSDTPSYPVSRGRQRAEGERVGAFVSFEGSAPVTVRVGTSFISVAQARTNLEREVGGRGFGAVADEAETLWDTFLNRVQVEGGTDEQRRTFYSALYRSLLFPRTFFELDSSGRTVHYSPYDGRVHGGPLFTDNGFWDTHRTVYPLLSLVYPETLGEILAGWLNAFKESGWLPKWASPGHRPVMIGTHIDAVFADAVVKGIGGFDLATAYEGLYRNATCPAPEGSAVGRVGLADYERLGYAPCDRVEHATSRTLDFAYNDFCVAQVAAALGKSADAERFLERAQNYRHVFDARVGFMRGRKATGDWAEPFSPFRWGHPFIEGSAWQFSLSVPHDPAGLAALFGGAPRLVKKLDTMLSTPPHFEVGSYPHEIHEMTEMAHADFGQYAHSNQPVHSYLYLYTHAGAPDKTQTWVRRVLDALYHSGPDGLPGDEDNGEMSAWYVLSAAGLFPACVGWPTYLLTTPLFDEVRVRPERGEGFVIAARPPESLPHAPFISGVALNGQAQDRLWLGHRELNGAVVRLTRGDQPMMPKRAPRLGWRNLGAGGR